MTRSASRNDAELGGGALEEGEVLVAIEGQELRAMHFID
jgi:hypothetical protein